MKRLLSIVCMLIISGRLCAASTMSENYPELHHSTIVANGLRLHFVVAGEGEPVLLLPGWPETWYAWRDIIPILVKSGRKVIVLDPRGFGDSEKPLTGYTPETVATDIHEFLAASGFLSRDGIDVVAHDLGTWIAFFHAARYPRDVRRIVLSEASIPGVSQPPSGLPGAAVNVKTWQFSFNRLPDLPEALVRGHEREFLTWLFDNKSLRPWRIDPESMDVYVRSYSRPGAARAGFSYFREMFSEQSLQQAAAARRRGLHAPVLTVGGEGGIGNALEVTLKPLTETLRSTVLQACGHFLPEECPEEFGKAILDFWSEVK